MAEFKRKNLFQLTWPLFLFALLSLGTTLADAILISQYSEDLNAAVSVANQILGVAYDLSALFSVGTVVLVAQRLGRNETEQAERIATLGIVANTLFSVLIAIAVVAAGPTLIGWVNTPAEVVSDALIYINVIAFAMAFNGFMVAAGAVLRSYGHTIEILVLGILANVLYLFLEYALIFGAFGFPELGVWGAALSTLIVRVSGVVLLIFVLRWRLKFSWSLRFDLHRTWRGALRIFRLSFPSVGDNIAYNSYQLIMLSFIAAIGKDAVNTRSWVLNITAFLAMLSLVISQGNEVLIGYDRGAGDNQKARKRGLYTAISTSIVVMLLAGLAYFFSDALMGLFMREENAWILSTAREVFLIGIILAPLGVITTILFNALKAVGDVNWPAGLSLAGTWVIGLPTAYLLVVRMELGLPGLWYTMLITELFKASVMFIRWQRMRWIQYHVMDDATPQSIETAE